MATTEGDFTRERSLREGRRARLAPWAGVPFALVYGTIARITFASDFAVLGELYGLMTIGFLFLVPVAIGALTVYLSPAAERESRRYCFWKPWQSAFIAMLLAGVLGIEAAVCLVIAAPIFFDARQRGWAALLPSSPASGRACRCRCWGW